MNDDAVSDVVSADPGAEDIRAALSAIQASSAFSASRQLSLFLAYVVEKTLAGEADRIKAYSIATEALGRPETFDPSADPIVRVEAGRLRKALEAYYQGEGAQASLRITIPRGSYVPRFERLAMEPFPAKEPDARLDEAVNTSAPQKGSAAWPWRAWTTGAVALILLLGALGVFAVRNYEAMWRGEAGPTVVSKSEPAAVQPALKPMAPRIHVVPFAVADDMATGITGSQFATKMATAISRFDEVTVVTRLDGDADYVVSGTLAEGPEGISAATLLTDRVSGRVIWSSQITVPRNPILPSSTIDELVADVAVAIAQPYGVVMSDRLARTDRPDDGFPCLIQSFNYWRDFTVATHADVRSCLEALTRRYPTYALAYAMLTFIYLDEEGLGFNVRPHSSAVDSGVKASAMAVQLAPTSARAQQALQYAYFATGQIDRAIETGKRAMLLNPLDTDVRASQGQVLIVAGLYLLGARLIEEAAAHNTAYPPWYDLYLALAAFQAGNEPAMRSLIRRVSLPGHPLAATLALIAGGADGTPDARAKALANMREHVPELVDDPALTLGRIIPNAELVDKLVAASRAAGLQN
jgi:TolB-like protein